ncbi:hypothetical protein HanRHA438_Chr10g0443791 [Helianthus annuus]|nr:hypothetical protein HanRHA438_Chr10g0443791 [Helianthus annuus]
MNIGVGKCCKVFNKCITDWKLSNPYYPRHADFITTGTMLIELLSFFIFFFVPSCAIITLILEINGLLKKVHLVCFILSRA